jgi:oligo-1,6-glucosidase
VLARGQVFTVGECPGVSPADAVMITNEETGALSMVFQFEHMGLDSHAGAVMGKWAYKPLELKDLKETTTRWQVALDGKGWNSLYLSNHDQPRTVSRFGDDGVYRVESAKMLGTFLHLLQGTPYVYQGEEIGMTNVRFPSIEDYRDIETFNMYREAVGRGMDPKKVMEAIYIKGRDNARTPMQWDANPQAGFTRGVPWLKVNPNFPTINSQQAVSDPESIYHYYRKLIQLRKDNPVIVYGSYRLILADHPLVYAFTRTLKNDCLLVLLNFSKETAACELPADFNLTGACLLIANYPVMGGENLGSLTLRPYEARVYRVNPS